MFFQFSAVSECEPGLAWRSTFDRLWPAYERWWQSEPGAARPTYLECRQALRQHMPEMIPIWERLVALAGGGDLVARFLSLYRPPAYLTGCSQAIWPGQDHRRRRANADRFDRALKTHGDAVWNPLLPSRPAQ